MVEKRLQEIEDFLKKNFPPTNAPECLSGGGAWREGGVTHFYENYSAKGSVSSRLDLPPDAYNVRENGEGTFDFSFGKEMAEVSPLKFFSEGEYSVVKFLKKEMDLSVEEIVFLQGEARYYLSE